MSNQYQQCERVGLGLPIIPAPTGDPTLTVSSDPQGNPIYKDTVYTGYLTPHVFSPGEAGTYRVGDEAEVEVWYPRDAVVPPLTEDTAISFRLNPMYGMYTPDEVTAFIALGYIPICNTAELDFIRNEASGTFGRGTEWEDTYASGLGKSYILLANLDLSIYYADSGWMPIGDQNEPFTGIFNGAGNIINNLFISSYDDYVGLFGYLCTGTIRYLGVTNVLISAAHNAGAIAGGVGESSLIEQCYSTGYITAISQGE